MDQGTPSQTSGQASPSFEAPSGIQPPEPMGGQPVKETGQTSSASPTPGSSEPVPVISSVTPPPSSNDNLQMPKKPVGSYLVTIFLVILLIVGILIFAAWKGWISLWGLGEMLNGSTTTTSTPVASTISPQISPVTTPSSAVSSSPAVTANVNDEARKKDLANIKNALEKYFTDKAAYPIVATKIKTSDPNNVLTQALVPNYLAQMPDDPLTPKYYYGYQSDGQTFELTCVLENNSDSAGTVSGGYNVYKITNVSSQ